MLIVNDDCLRLAGIVSLEERCPYCSKTLAAYPLVMSDDAKQTVYHVTCALELATDIMTVSRVLCRGKAVQGSIF